jgi:hypothetical protein
VSAARDARELLTHAENISSAMDETNPAAELELKAAHVHAMLAVAEEQRIANLIEAYRIRILSDPTDYLTAGDDDLARGHADRLHEPLRLAIIEGMGL